MLRRPNYKGHFAQICAGIFGALLGLSVGLFGFEGWRLSLHDLLAWGDWPLFLAFTYVYNLVIVPFPYDPFLLAMPILVPERGLGVWWLSASVGMGLAAVSAYILAKYKLGPRLRPWLLRQKGYARTERVLQRHGQWAAALSAITPLPFSLVAWLAGLLGLPFASTMAWLIGARALRNALVVYAVGVVWF